MYEFLREYVPVGKENAIHLPELAERTRKNQRSLKILIRNARLEGIPILSDSTGYWISNDKEEQRAYLAMVTKDATSRMKTVSHLRKTLRIPDSQTNTWELIDSLINRKEDKENE